MIIPHRMLSPEALRGVIEAFITRGTDYGLYEVPLATKVGQVRHQLDAGIAVIVYDEATDSCTIQPRISSRSFRPQGCPWRCWAQGWPSTPAAVIRGNLARACVTPVRK